MSGLFLPPKKSPLGDLWETHGVCSFPKRKPHKLGSYCETSTCLSAPPGTRTPNLLIKSSITAYTQSSREVL